MTLTQNKIILHQLNMTLNNPFHTSFGTVQAKDFFIIEVQDNQGNRGYGESVAFTAPWYTAETTETTKHVMIKFLIPLLQQANITHPAEITDIFAPIKQHHMAKAALETAYWDLYAKQQGTPLYQLLGGTRGSIDVGVSLGIERDFIILSEKVAHYIALGYKRVKLKIKPGYDIDLVKHVRQEFPTLNIMVDANGAYTLADLTHLKELDAYDLMMIEQPLPEDALLEHALLQKELATPICLDESIHSLADTKIALTLGSCKIINIKQARVGGLTEAIKIHDYCREQGIPVWCGGMLEAGVGRAHNIALATLTNFTIPGDIAGSAHYFAEDIITPEVLVHDGTIFLPEKPGIGYDINPELLKKYTVNKFEF